jgi:glucosylglycerate synthase
MASTGSNSSAPSTDDEATSDVIVGVPVSSQATAIGEIVRSARVALSRELAGLRGKIIIVDAEPTDGTPAQVELALGDDPDCLIVLPAQGNLSRGRALRRLFEVALERGARGVAAIDGTAAVTPAWIANLARPLVDGEFDFVAPRYRRHLFDGALTKSIVQPVFRACFGLRIEQPMATEFGCSRRLLEHVLHTHQWPGDNDQTQIDLWLTTTAVSGGFKVCEALVGPRRRGSRDEAQDLSGTIAHIVGGLFNELERRAGVWHRVRGSAAVPAFGTAPDDPLEAPAVNPSNLLDSFRLGYRELSGVWAAILPPATILEFRRLAAASPESFRIDDRLWARTIYDFALGHRLRVMVRDHLLRSLTPLYLGWLASFILAGRNAPESEIEACLERTGQAFEDEKPYLISRWRWPERFRPVRFE